MCSFFYFSESVDSNCYHRVRTVTENLEKSRNFKLVIWSIGILNWLFKIILKVHEKKFKS